MKYLYTLTALSFAVGAVNAQTVGTWGQCGGIGHTGGTACTAGTYCTTFNPYYAQCIPGTAAPTTTTTRSTTAVTTTSRTTTTSSTRTTTTTRTSSTTTRTSTTTSRTTSRTSTTTTTTSASGCTGTFTPVSASAAFAALNPGWNIGNTLDAIPNEGSWNNPPVVASLLDNIKAHGFKSVRIPVTWTHHFSVESAPWTVDPTWMTRVETVVDLALARGFWVVLNVHHDSWEWADYTNTANIPQIQERFKALWDQIAARFKCKSEKLIFEPLNEPTGSTQEHGVQLKALTDIFLTSINAAGGYNPQRVVSLSGIYQDVLKTAAWFQRGTVAPNQPWGLQVHYYSPYDFIFGAWGKTTWGTAEEKASLDSEFSQLRGNFSNVPIFVGEWQASSMHTESAARWRYYDFFLQTLKKYNIQNIMWDNGEDHLNRTINKFYDQATHNIFLKGTAGVKNALAVHTVDGAAETQSSSAYIFHKVGTAVTAQSASYELNGNTLGSITTSSGSTLSASSYSWDASSGTLTLTQAYLSTLYSAMAAPGIKETLTLNFTPGAALTLTIVQYDVPTVAQSTWSINSVPSNNELWIPITFKGLEKAAAVRAVYNDGTYVADDWTQWLGPLQRARWTYGQWGFKPGHINIWSNGINQLKSNKPAAATSAILSFEFYPRNGYTAGSNALNITITF